MESMTSSKSALITQSYIRQTNMENSASFEYLILLKDKQESFLITEDESLYDEIIEPKPNANLLPVQLRKSVANLYLSGNNSFTTVFDVEDYESLWLEYPEITCVFTGESNELFLKPKLPKLPGLEK